MQPVILGEWLDFYRASGASRHTVRLRLVTMRSLLRHAGEPDPLTITARQVVAWLASLESSRTRVTYRSGAKQFYSWALRYGLIDSDPMLLVPKVKNPASVPRPVDTAVIVNAIRQARTWQSRAYLTLGFYEGLRVHEIAKVHSDDVDLATGTLFVDGKGGHQAFLPMHPLVLTLARSLGETGWWFPADTVLGHVRAQAVSRTVKDALLRAGAPTSATAHALRHSFITSLFDTTSNARVVQELARHASLQTTQGYARVQHDAMRLAIGKLAA